MANLIYLRSTTSLTPAFDPSSLFASGEEGAWYEPSTSTCFTDASGTVAATYGDGVAYLQDLSGNGNHATQVTAGARPILARVPEGGRRNLLEYTEQFDDAYWSSSNVSFSGQTITDASTSYGLIQRVNIPVTSGSTYTVSFSIAKTTSATTYPLVQLGRNMVDSQSSYAAVIVDTNNGSLYEVTGGGYIAPVSSSIITDPSNSDYWLVSVTDVMNASLSRLQFYPAASSNGTTLSATAQGSSTVRYAQLEAGSTATAYQKVVNEYDVTEAGVTSLEYLAFDGSDDSFVISGSQAWYDQYIGSIVIAASTDSTSDQDVVSNRGVDSAGVRGKYALSIRNSGVNWSYDNLVAGSGSSTSTASPINTPYVFYGSGDGTNVSSSINSGSVTTATDSYTARGLDAYIGQTGNSVTYFSGRIYGIVLTNDVLTTQEISDTESYLAAKSGVTL